MITRATGGLIRLANSYKSALVIAVRGLLYFRGGGVANPTPPNQCLNMPNAICIGMGMF